MAIKVGTVGKILAGDEVGRYLKVVDDSENTGGFLILTAHESSMINAFDSWVENDAALEKFFKEAQWLVQWMR